MSSITTELIHRIPVANTLGEGIQWHIERGEAWWSDIIESKLYAYHWESKSLTVFAMPEPVCSFAFITNDVRLLVAFATGIAFYNLETEEVEWIHPNLCDGKKHRLNDGRVDRQGRFWFGSMVLSDDEALQNTGRLYYLSSDLSLDVKETGVQISNGLCWSVGSETMFFADSPKQEIYAYDCDAQGHNTHKRKLLSTPAHAYPDGANVDANNRIWSAHWAASEVVCYDEQGNILSSIATPASQPTCIAFGGNDLSLLFVSSATQDMSDEQLANEPRAGDVFVYQTNAQGLPEQQFVLNNNI